jgi:voltage-gated potassium channel Kch
MLRKFVSCWRSASASTYFIRLSFRATALKTELSKTFPTVWLGMWWAIQTVTTVGYGDVVPGSTVGKVIATFLMLGGLSLYAVVTGAITSAFVAQRQKDPTRGEDPVSQKLDEMTAKLDALQSEVARLRPGGD